MHLEILVEDQSGAALVGVLMPKVAASAGGEHTWQIHSYKGLGRVPKDLRGSSDPRKRILLDRLPDILRGYGRSLQPEHHAVLVLVDSDRRNCREFKNELLEMFAQSCPLSPAPRTLFRLAVEEIEAWLLGDRQAILEEFPKAKIPVLESYPQDGICGTWEKLADAIHPGGSKRLSSLGYAETGRMKSEWARRIGPRLELKRNQSPSFQAFVRGAIRLLSEGT